MTRPEGEFLGPFSSRRDSELPSITPVAVTHTPSHGSDTLSTTQVAQKGHKKYRRFPLGLVAAKRMGCERCG